MGLTRVLAVAAAVAVLAAGCASAAPSPDASASPSRSADTAIGAVGPVAAPASTKEPDAIVVPSVEAIPDKPDTVNSTSLPAVLKSNYSYAQRLFEYTNQARRDNGVGALKWSSCAQSAAIARAGRALTRTTLSHEPLGTINCAGGYLGENLARYPGGPEGMFKLWMGSPGHRENILNPKYTTIGIGCAAYSKGSGFTLATEPNDVLGRVCAQVFLG